MTDRTRTPADLEQTFRDVTDPDYTAGLGEEGPGGLGLDPVAAQAATLARASDAVRRNTQAYFLLPSSQQSDDPASGAVRASGAVDVTRVARFPVDITIPAGAPLQATRLTSIGGPAPMPEFVLAEALVFAVGVAGPLAGIATAVRAGNQGNIEAGILTGFAAQGTGSIDCTIDAANFGTDTGIPDVFWEGLVGRYLEFTAGANLGEVRRVIAYSQAGLISTVLFEGSALAAGAATVRPIEWSEIFAMSQPQGLTNGRHGTLETIGRERLTGRAEGESDLDYAYRLNTLADIVSPGAIDRLAASILTPVSIRYRIHETRLGITGMALDLAPLDTGDLCTADPLNPFGTTVLLSATDAARFFVVCVSVDPMLGVFGLPFDAGNAGINAFDSGSNPGDGYAVIYQQAIQKLWQAVNGARAFGVGFEIVADPDL